MATLRAILARAGTLGLPVLVVGPPPVADPAVTGRIVELDALLHAVAGTISVPYVSVVRDLRDDLGWADAVREGDGAHPGSTGYALLAALVRPLWEAWLAGLDDDRPA